MRLVILRHGRPEAATGHHDPKHGWTAIAGDGTMSRADTKEEAADLLGIRS